MLQGESRAVLSDIRDVGFKDQPESTQKVSELRMGSKPSPDLDLRRATVTPGGTGRRAGEWARCPRTPAPPDHEARLHGGLGY